MPDPIAQALLGCLISGALVVSVGALVLYFVWRQRRASRRALVRQVEELTALSEAVRSIASSRLDEDALCQLVYENASKLVDTGSFHLGVFDGPMYTTRVRYFQGARQDNLTVDLSDGPSIVAWIRESGKPLLIRDFDREQHELPAQPRTVSQFPPKSLVYVPLSAGDQAIGAMSIASDKVGAYTESHLRVLSIIANQAAAAILNARALALERRRAQQLELVDKVATQTAALLEIDTLFPRLVASIRDAFGLYTVGLYLLDDEKARVVCRASTMSEEVGTQLDLSTGLIATCLHGGTLVIVDDALSDERFLFAPNMPDTRSEAVVPLFIDDAVVGALDLQSDRPSAFSHDDARYLEVLGQQVAVAVEDARLYEAEREQAWMATALLQVAEVSQSAESFDDAVEAIATLAPMLTGVDACAVLTYDGVFDEFRIASLRGQLSEFENLVVGDVLLIEDVPALKKMIETNQPAFHTDTGRLSLPVLALPLSARNELLGALLVARATGEPFPPRRVELLTGLANQSALVLDGVRANVAQQEEAWVTAALLQTARALSETKDADAIAVTMARLVPLLVGVQACAIFVRDSSGFALRPSADYGLSSDAHARFIHNELSAAALREWLVAHEQASSANALDNTPAEIAEDLSLRFSGMVELVANNRIVGAVVVGATRADQLPRGRSRDILLGIAQQTALAVDGARLYRESLQAQRLERELEVARSIQTSFFPKVLPTAQGWSVGAAWEAARQVSGDFYDFIRLPNDRWGLIIADVADKGVPAALFMALSRTILRAAATSAAFPNGRPPDMALARANELIISDASADLFVTVFYAIWNPQTAELSYANGGHNPPLMYHGGDVRELNARGMALGAIEQITVERHDAQLACGDALLLYTDGIVDALNSAGDEFGMARLKQVFVDACHLPANAIVASVLDAVRTHAGDEPPFDDQTLLVVKREAD